MRLIAILILTLNMGLLLAQPQPAASKAKTDQVPANALPQKQTEQPFLGNLPAGSIFVLCEQAADSLRLLPKMVVISPEKFQEMQDELKKLREKNLKPAAALLPSSMKLTCKTDGTLAKIKAKYSFHADSAGSTVQLGMGTCQAVSSVLAGKTPVIKKTAEGFLLQSDDQGIQELEMDFLAMVRQANGKFSLTLDLPGSSITQMDMELPSFSTELKLDTKPTQEAIWNFTNNKLSASLGNATSLELKWEITPKTNTARAITSETEITTRLDDRSIRCQAKMKVGSTGGRLDQLEILVPLGSEIRGADITEENKILRITKEDRKFFSSQKIIFKDGVFSNLRLVVDSVTTFPSTGSVIPIGPYYVLQAVRQTGIILISEEGSDIKFQPVLKADMDTQDVPPSDKSKSPPIASSFRYWNHPFQDKPNSIVGQGSISIMDLETFFVRGELEIRSNFSSKLVFGDEKQLQWQTQAILDCKPLRTGVEKLEIQVPKSMRYDRSRGISPQGLIQSDTMDEKTGKLLLVFQKEQTQPFQLSLNFDHDASDQETELLQMPLTVNTRDKGTQISIQTPENLRLIPDQKKNPNLELIAMDSNHLTWKSERSTARITVVKRPVRENITSNHHIQFVLFGDDAFVKQTIQLSAQKSPDYLTKFVWHGDIPVNLKITQGGSLENLNPQDGSMQVLMKNEEGKNPTIIIEYKIPVDTSREISVPICMVPETTNQASIRIWNPSDLSPEFMGTGWTRNFSQNTDENSQLPALSVTNPDAKEAFKFIYKKSDSPITFAKAPLGMVKIENDHIKARILVQLRDPLIDRVHFKLPPEATGAKAWLNQQEMRILSNESSNFVLLPFEFGKKSTLPILELEYQTPRSNGIISNTKLTAPQFTNLTEKIYWLVTSDEGTGLAWPRPCVTPLTTWKRSGLFLAPVPFTAFSSLNRLVDLKIQSPLELLPGQLFHSTSHEMSVLVFQKRWFQLLFTCIVIPPMLIFIWKREWSAWVFENALNLVTVMIITTGCVYSFSSIWLYWIGFAIEPLILLGAIVFSIHLLAGVSKKWQSRRFGSFVATSKAPSTIKYSERVIAKSNATQKVELNHAGSTGYWVKPDPSSPPVSLTKANSEVSSQTSLPD